MVVHGDDTYHYHTDHRSTDAGATQHTTRQQPGLSACITWNRPIAILNCNKVDQFDQGKLTVRSSSECTPRNPNVFHRSGITSRINNRSEAHLNGQINDTVNDIPKRSSPLQVLASTLRHTFDPSDE